MTIPNVDGLALRAVTGMYSYDHDLASFVASGSATVSEDGSTITSDAGAGVIKAGWHCGGNPSSTGSVGTCPTCQKCLGNNCVADNGQSPPQASPTDCKEQYCNGGGVANRNQNSETPTDVCKQCSNGSEQNRSDGSTLADTNSCCFNGERLEKYGQAVGNVLDGSLEAKCPDRTQHSSRLHDVDGCSSLGPQPNDPMQIYPYPSGLLNQAPTAFGNPVGIIANASAAGPQPCNQHDICYQTCATPGASLSATRQVCDAGMKSRMDNVCAAAYPSTCPASLGALQCVDYFLQRTDCYTYSAGYWTTLRGAGFFAAYKARQEQYCQCCH